MSYLFVQEDFEKALLDLPKLTPKFVTHRTAYLAKTVDGEIVVKISRKTKIIINPNGTWEQLFSEKEL